MAFQSLSVVPLEKARNEYLALLIQNGMVPQAEVIPVISAAGRVTSGALYARICAPQYNASAMDGIALEAKLTSGAGEASPVLLAEGQYRRINTGDHLPIGCDAVIMIEDVIELENGVVKLLISAAPWQNIRQIGEDICAGEMILPSYSPITPVAIGALIAGGICEV